MTRHVITVTIDVDDSAVENTARMLGDLTSAIDSEVQEFEAWMDHGMYPEENEPAVKRGHGGHPGPYVESYTIEVSSP